MLHNFGIGMRIYWWRPESTWPSLALMDSSRMSNLHVWVVYMRYPFGTMTERGCTFVILFYTFVLTTTKALVALLSMIVGLFVVDSVGCIVGFTTYVYLGDVLQLLGVEFKNCVCGKNILSPERYWLV